MKGVSGIITFVLTFGIVLTAITVVWISGKPVIDKSEDSAMIAESNGLLSAFDSTIKDVVYGKAGSSRLLSLSISGGRYFVRNDDNSIEFSLDTSDTFIEPSAQTKSGNLYTAGARDVTAYQKTINGVDSMVLENSNIKYVIRNVNQTNSINTSNLTLFITNKQLGVNVTAIDSSIYMNGVTSTREGSGYTYFVDNGTRFGYAQIVAHVVSGSIIYDVYYTLHANADFVNIEVKNTTGVSSVNYLFESSLTSGSVGTGTNYITYSNGTTATGLYHNGLSLTSITNTNNRMNITQDEAGNGILQIFTKAPASTISDANVADIKKWSGSFGYGTNKEPKYYSWLYYPIINFTRNETFGKGSYKLYIYNNGTSNGKAQIEISVI